MVFLSFSQSDRWEALFLLLAVWMAYIVRLLKINSYHLLLRMPNRLNLVNVWITFDWVHMISVTFGYTLKEFIVSLALSDSACQTECPLLYMIVLSVRGWCSCGGSSSSEVYWEAVHLVVDCEVQWVVTRLSTAVIQLAPAQELVLTILLLVMVLSCLLLESVHVIKDASIRWLPLFVYPAQVSRSLGELVALTIVTVLIVTFAPIGHRDSWL